MQVGTLAGTVSVLGPQSNYYLGGGFIGGGWPDEPNYSATNNTGRPEYFTGSIADVGFYTSPLTQANVTALYNAGTHAANLLSGITRPSGNPYAAVSYDSGSASVTQLTDENGGVWHFGAPTVSGSSQIYRSSVLGSAPLGYFRLGDTAGAAQAYDEVNAGNAALSNVTLGVSGPFSDASAASFNGTSSYLTPPSINALPQVGPVTVEMWFKTAANGPGGILFSTGHSQIGTQNPNSGAMPVLYVGSDGKLYGQYWTGSVAPMVSSGKVNDGNWHQVALSGAGSSQTLYLDGNTVGSLSGQLANLDPLNFVGAGLFNGNPWVNKPASGWSYFTGSIGEVALYKFALSAGDIGAHYLAARNSQGLAPMTTATITDPGNKTLSINYDPLHGNRRVAFTDALGKKTTDGYDTDGFLQTVTDANGAQIYTGHDVRGNTVSQISCQNEAALVCSTAYYTYFPDDTTAQLTTPDPRNDLMLTIRDGRSASATDNTYLTSYTYDTAGNKTAVTTPPVPGFPSGRTTAVTYSDGSATYPATDSGNVPAGMPVKTTSPGGAVNTIAYLHTGDVANTTNGDGLVTRYTYDGLGRVSGKTEVADSYPNGLTTSYTYDGRNQVTNQTDPPVTDRVTGAIHGAATTSTYDADGNLTAQTVADTTGGDASRTVSATYNAAGHQATAVDANGNTTSFTYDAYGNKISETDPAGTETDWTYDPNGHELTQGIWYTGSPVNPQPRSFLTEQSRAYDPAGRLASITDSMGNATAYTYFDNGLTATVTRTDSGGANPFVEENDSYDAAGNLVKKVTNNGATTEQYTVDAAARTTQTVQDPTGVNRTTTVSYTPDDKPATTTQTDGSGATRTTTATYDPMGNPTSQTVYGDGAGHPVGWWRLNQTSGTTVTDSSGTGNTATASGVTWANGAASFAGTSGQQVATNGPVLNTAGTFTVSAWANLANTNGWASTLSQDGNQTSGFYLQYDQADNAWAFSKTLTDTTNPAGVRAHGIGAPALNTWTHLVGVFDSSTGAMSLYVNGTLAGTATDTTPFNASGPLAIGRAKFNGNPVDFFPGSIGNVQVYSRALSPSEISTLYSAGRSGGTVASSNQITTSRTLDKRGLPTSMTDPNGNVTTYSNDEAGKLAVTTAPTVQAETGGGTASPVHPVTTDGYNTFGEPTENQDPNGNVTTTAYDAEGHPVSVTQPNYTPPGSSTAITAVTVKTYDKTGKLVTEQDPLTNTTHCLYDQLGDLVQTTNPAGGTTTSTFDTNGDTLSVTDASGAQTQATYDHLGRAVTKSVLERYPSTVTATTNYSYAASSTNPGGAQLASTTSPNGVTTSTAYDNVGETISSTDGAGNTTHYAYDFAGRPTTTTLADATSTVVGYDTADRPLSVTHKDGLGGVLTQSSATYDAAGNQLSTTDARGNTSTFTYDAVGGLTQEVQPVSAGSAITTSFGYDAAGNRTRFTDGRGNPFIYTYNSWNKQESVIEPTTAAYTTASNRTFTSAYDADGHLVSQTQPGGVTVTATYNNLGDLTSQTGTGAEAATAPRHFGSAPVGRLTSAATTAIGTSGNPGYVPASNETFTYNDRGHLLSTAGTGGSSSFGYNTDGLMTSRADAAGTTSYGYDTAGRLASTTEATTGTQLSYSYNALNQVTQVGYGSGGNTRSYTYDPLHRLTGDTLKTNGGATIASIGYGYDANSNLTSKTTTGFTGAATNVYTYDQANRLTSWNNGAATVNYGYDASGNRTQVGANVYTYDARDQLTSDGTNSYTYSARGTLTAQTSTSGTAVSASDAFGQMTAHNGQSYAYDALGRVLTDTPSSGSGISFAYTGTDNTVASDGMNTYTYDPSGAVLGVGTAASGGGTVAGSGVLAFTDAHTDIVGQFTATGTTLTGSQTYDPLGNVLGATGMKGQLGFQSAWTDHATGKVDMATRWYNPGTGQFMNRDTVALNPVPNSAAANPFAYVNDNPLTGTDPSGHGWFDWVGDAVHAVTSSVASAYNATAGAVSSAVSWINTTVIQPAITFVNNDIIQPVVHAVQTVVHHVVDAYHAVTRWVRRAGRWVARTVVHVAHRVVHAVRTAYHAVNRVVHTVSRIVRNVAHTVRTAVTTAVHSAGAIASAAKTVGHAATTALHATTQAAAAVATFVKNHATTIASFAAGAAAFVGCEALTAGAGTVGCAALAGAVGNGVAYAMDCHKTGKCSLAGAAEAVGLGAAGGALGGALAGPLGGRLVSQALDGVLPEVAVQGLVGGGAGGITGAATGAANYGMNCGSNCSLAGAAHAAGSGAAGGALLGGIAGGSAPLAGRAWAGLRNSSAPRAGTETPTAAACHSFTGNTLVKLADGRTKPISQVKIGEQVNNAVPGESGSQTHAVGKVIVTTTDHDFVDLTITADKPGLGNRLRGLAGKTVAGLAVAATVVAGGAGTATAAPATPQTADDGAATITTTYHHPFYDITQAAFVDAVDLRVGDQLQTDTNTPATVTAVHPYHSTATTYDLTIPDLHTYYVEAGTTPVLVHNCGESPTSVAASSVRFSQSSVNGAEEITRSMSANGWVGDPIDVVRMPDGGLTSVDNTRVLAARQAGIDVQAAVHGFDDLLPSEYAGRFTTPKGGTPNTWGDAVLNRIGSQNSGYRRTYPYGSDIIGWSGN